MTSRATKIRTRYASNRQGTGTVRAVLANTFTRAKTVQWDHALSSDANHARAHMALVRYLRRLGIETHGTWSMTELEPNARVFTLDGATTEPNQ